MNILKFGGTSMADHQSWKQILDIVRRHAKPIVVVSATSGTTNALLKAAHAACDGHLEDAQALADEIDARHRKIVHDFADAYGSDHPQKSSLHDEAFERIDQLIAGLRNYLVGIHTLGELTDRSLDAIASVGERLSSYLITICALLDQMPAVYVDAADIIRTDGRHTAAAPDMEAISYKAPVLKKAVESGQIPIMGGFYGSNAKGDITTLGRGGSDYSASLIGLAVGADSIGIWTDVSGMYTSDPRFVKGTRSIPEISFAEAAELAYFGAKVLHPATIQPAVERNIPVLVKNTFEPDHPGTTIRVDAEGGGEIRAIAFKKDITVITVTSTRMLLAHGFMAKVFAVFEQHKVSVDLVTTSEVSISITVDSIRNLDAVVTDLQQFAQAKVRPGQALICLVGQQLIESKGVVAKVFQALHEIPIHMISQGSSDINLSLVVDNTDVIGAVQALHDTFLTEG